jgi:hypothetical protein
MSRRNKQKKIEPAPVVEREPSPACPCGSPTLNTLGVNSKLIDGQRINWTRRRCPKCGKATTERSCLMI